MAARVGITRDRVVDAAVDELARVGRPDQVSLRAVADRLGVRTQSLYAHVDGSAGLARALARRGLDGLAVVVAEAAMGRSGDEALAAILTAHLDFAKTHPGLYQASIHPPGDDAQLLAAIARVTRPLDLVLESSGLDADQRVHAIRISLAAVYGFTMLRRDGQLTLAADPDVTEDHLVAVLVGQGRTVVTAR